MAKGSKGTMKGAAPRGASPGLVSQLAKSIGLTGGGNHVAILDRQHREGLLALEMRAGEPYDRGKRGSSEVCLLRVPSTSKIAYHDEDRGIGGVMLKSCLSIDSG